MRKTVRLLCIALAALAFGCQPITWDAPHGDAGATTTTTPHKLGAGPPLYGPTTVALAQAVALASDHAPIAVTGSISPGTIGQATMANSAPVVIASNQSSVAVNDTALAQPTVSSAVTPSDSTVLACGKGLWIGTAGNLSLKLSGDSAAVTWKNVPSGSFTPGNVIRVMVATTAADVVCLN